MNNEEIDYLCKRITTWDQTELDKLIGQPAIDYARNHEADVRRLAHIMGAVFPFGRRWWKIDHALRNVFAKNDAIKARAARISADRKAGRIVERRGRLVYKD